ncbi:unnamed protein product [Schistocephalus solidus]|uniref:Uncharacterized protein n=1 Tax=Schistocephalus solidus TaxID=70667 RepID=A0A183SEB1_SCHSO|nr:unnamed protein product [Schistocephalus solidus]
MPLPKAVPTSDSPPVGYPSSSKEPLVGSENTNEWQDIIGKQHKTSIKLKTNLMNPSGHSEENMIGSESKDALDRENCVVIQGLPESTAHTSKERISADLAMFQHLLNDILHSGETITVRAAFRLGKKDIEQSQNVKPRPIKIVLDNKEEAKLLLSRKTNLRNSHKQIFFSRTTLQQNV